MKLSEWFLALVLTIAMGIICYLIDLHDHETLTTPEITVHGPSNANQ
jgi:hypothetical protein